MSWVTEILNCVLAHWYVKDIIWDIEVHASLFAFASTAVLSLIDRKFYFPTLWVETILQAKSNSLLPSVMQVILSKRPEFDVALIPEINKFKFEMVPVVEGEGVRIDFFIKR
jgi:hypothetical protein